MAATAQLYLGLYVRVFQPLAKLGPLRALTASVRALSETLGFLADLRVAVLDGYFFYRGNEVKRN